MKEIYGVHSFDTNTYLSVKGRLKEKHHIQSYEYGVFLSKKQCWTETTPDDIKCISFLLYGINPICIHSSTILPISQSLTIAKLNLKIKVGEFYEV